MVKKISKIISVELTEQSISVFDEPIECLIERLTDYKNRFGDEYESIYTRTASCICPYDCGCDREIEIWGNRPQTDEERQEDIRLEDERKQLLRERELEEFNRLKSRLFGQQE